MSGRINLSNLSDSLKEHLNGLGLTEEQVNELIEEALVEINEKDIEQDEVVNGLIDKVGELNGLMTEEKGDLVGAINELFQDVDSGKGIIADAIDDRNISKDSTFAAMGEAIEGIHADREEDRQKLIEILQGSNMDLTGNESMDTLLDLIDMSNLDLSKVIQISCGHYHAFLLKNDGSLWACGRNNEGQLGLGDTTNRTTFTQVTTNINNDVKEVVCGYNRTFIIKNDGSLWACGYNEIGELGFGDTGNDKMYSTFTQVTNNINNDVKQVDCGYYYTMIVKNDGSLWATGHDEFGETGLYTIRNTTIFTQVTTNINNDVKQVACSFYCTFIVKNDGSLWACGLNNYYQLGLGHNNNYIYTFTQVTTNINNDVKQVACSKQTSGTTHTLVLKNDGSLWGCCNNEYGQLGLGTAGSGSKFVQITVNVNNDVKQIACGVEYSVILKNDGSVWSCGNVASGRLGIGATSGAYKNLTKITSNLNNDAAYVTSGGFNTMILKNDATVLVCGMNNYGQLGIGTTETQYSMVAINQSEALKTQVTALQLEATANRGNLATVLTDEGVELTGDETLADLIVKTDEEFDRQNDEMSVLETELAGKVTPVGTAVASNVLSGKTFINSTGQTITGTMANMSTHTQVADYVAWNADSIYLGIPTGAYVNVSSTGYPEVYINKTRLDSNLVPENIVSGKSICGVNGTAKSPSSLATTGDVSKTSTTYTNCIQLILKSSPLITVSTQSSNITEKYKFTSTVSGRIALLMNFSNQSTGSYAANVIFHIYKNDSLITSLTQVQVSGNGWVYPSSTSGSNINCFVNLISDTFTVAKNDVISIRVETYGSGWGDKIAKCYSIAVLGVFA